jgi:hypothetical protein
MSSLRTGTLAVTVLALAAWGCGVNRSYNIEDGTTRSSGIRTVNGSVRVGSDCKIGGECRTVNGRVELGDRSSSGSLHTVNGRVEVGARCEVDGDVTTVNGSVTCGPETQVEADVTTVNGTIRLSGTRVGRNVELVNGDVLLEDGAVVAGDIVISGSGNESDVEIRIGPGSVVEGDVRARASREVRVILVGDGEVRGEIRGAEVIREGGESPTLEDPAQG